MKTEIEKHVAYLSADELKKICAPLFQQFPISYFCYARKYKDNSIMVLNSHREWYQHYLTHRYPLLITGQKTLHTWVEYMPEQAIREGAVYCNIHNGVVVEKQHSNFIEILEFASPTQHDSPINFCSNKDLLNQFSLYFKDKGNFLLKAADQEKILLPQEMHANYRNVGQSYEEFLKAISTKKITLNFSGKEVFFSKREFEVLSLLAEGKTTRQAGEQLCLSSRTVETYLNNAKNKTDAFSTSQLIDNFKKNLF